MRIAFLFYEGMTALDAIGPHEVLARLPEVTILRVAKNPGVIHTGLDLILMADYGFSEVSQADILVLPGSATASSLRHCPETLDWVRAIHATTAWTTSVCTGSLILGAAGLLSGVKATSHWAVLSRLRHWGAEPVAARVVESGKIITAAGVSAGIDMALSLAAKVAGKEEAEMLQLCLEYDPEPPFNSGSPAKASKKVLEKLQARISTRFEAE